MYLSVTPDTVMAEETAVYHLRILLKNCEGEMYIERRLLSNNNLVLSGHYKAAEKLDTVQIMSMDPLTGKRTLREIGIFKPHKDGTWRYFDADSKALIKQEEYESGKLKSGPVD